DSEREKPVRNTGSLGPWGDPPDRVTAKKRFMVLNSMREFNRKLQASKLFWGGAALAGPGQPRNDDHVVSCPPAGIDDHDLSLLCLCVAYGSQRSGLSCRILQANVVGRIRWIGRHVDVQAYGFVGMRHKLRHRFATGVRCDQRKHWQYARSSRFFQLRY